VVTATSVVRDELVRVRAGRECDRRAELAGFLRAAGTLTPAPGGVGVEAATEHPAVARRLFEALSQALGARSAVRLLEPGRGHRHQRYAVRAEGIGLQRLVEAGILDEGGARSAAVPRRVVAKRCCVGAYLRGAFLARGSASDPRKAAHLEIRAPDEATAADLAAMLDRAGARASVRHHHGWAAYTKSTESVGAALAAMGAHGAYMSWEAGSIWKGVHVSAGRLANADTANARRLARAAVAHLSAIDEVEQAVGLQSLPEALREMASLRRAHPSASLDELARLCDPPITKAAAADRLRRIARLVPT
jgi:DNA-binding protein WhiA